jgi:hypothetical protein
MKLQDIHVAYLIVRKQTDAIATFGIKQYNIHIDRGLKKNAAGNYTVIIRYIVLFSFISGSFRGYSPTKRYMYCH